MKKILITGGAGFIGVNLAAWLLRQKGNVVIVYDNLSRTGAEHNLKWLQAQRFSNLRFTKGDIRDFRRLKEVTKGIDEIYHLAAQVAVTKSVENPLEDFEINAQGTLYLLEACREKCPQAIFIFASTNKVYGELLNLKLRKGRTRYRLVEPSEGIAETESLDFHSPYGCAKGAADQYVRDYHRIYGLKTVVFRQSCIYGPHQFGCEDQGWVAHFVIKALQGKTINIYGDGKQVRDVLEVSDLIDAYARAVKKIGRARGQIYNIGGGPGNTLSLLELIEFLEKVLKRKVAYSFSDWRPGDQKVFISNNRKLRKELGWTPAISKEEGVGKLVSWVQGNVPGVKGTK